MSTTQTAAATFVGQTVSRYRSWTLWDHAARHLLSKGIPEDYEQRIVDGKPRRAAIG